MLKRKNLNKQSTCLFVKIMVFCLAVFFSLPLFACNGSGDQNLTSSKSTTCSTKSVSFATSSKQTRKTTSSTTTKKTTRVSTTSTVTATEVSTKLQAKPANVAVSRANGAAACMRIFIDEQQVCVYNEKDEPIDAFYCSTGMYDTTPLTGEKNPIYISAYKSDKLRFNLVGDVWVRYPTQIYGDYFFHSMPYIFHGLKNPLKKNECMLGEYWLLGSGPSSHGCVRLTLRDAYLIQQYAFWEMPLYVLQNNAAGHKICDPRSLPEPDGHWSDDGYFVGWEPTDWENPDVSQSVAPTAKPTTKPAPPTTTTKSQKPHKKTTSKKKPITTKKPVVPPSKKTKPIVTAKPTVKKTVKKTVIVTMAPVKTTTTTKANIATTATVAP